MARSGQFANLPIQSSEGNAIGEDHHDLVHCREASFIVIDVGSTPLGGVIDIGVQCLFYSFISFISDFVTYVRSIFFACLVQPFSVRL